MEKTSDESFQYDVLNHFKHKVTLDESQQMPKCVSYMAECLTHPTLHESLKAEMHHNSCAMKAEVHSMSNSTYSLQHKSLRQHTVL